MAYLGRQPIIGNYQVLDALTATTTDTYALTKNSVAVFPQTPANCIVSLNGVIQAPFDSYTISGSNIVFASALTGSDSIDFITVLGDVLNVGTVSDGTITTAKIANDAVTKDKLFAHNYPAFFARLSSNQTIASASLVKIQLDSVIIDTDSAFDNVTNYRFTVPSGKGGIYYIAHQIGANGYTASRTISIPHKNGVGIVESESFNSSASYNHSGNSFIINLSDGDYLELYGYQNSGGTANIRGAGLQYHTYLSAFRIGD